MFTLEPCSFWLGDKMVRMISEIYLIIMKIQRWPWILERLPQKALLGGACQTFQQTAQICWLCTSANLTFLVIYKYSEPFWVNGKLELGLFETSFSYKLWNLTREIMMMSVFMMMTIWWMRWRRWITCWRKSLSSASSLNNIIFFLEGVGRI